jgi:hypothetical protein
MKIIERWWSGMDARDIDDSAALNKRVIAGVGGFVG